MKTFGPGMPSRTPATDARLQHRILRRLALRRLLVLQSLALRDAVLESLRIVGVVLVVLSALRVHASALWLVLVLLAAPQLYAVAHLLGQAAARAWRRHRMREAN